MGSGEPHVGLETPFGYWGLDSVFWSFVRLFISDIHALTEYGTLPDHVFCLDGRHPIHRVCLLGVVVDVRVYATNTMLSLDDGTGTIATTWWNKQIDEPEHSDHLGQILVVHGRLSTYRGQRQIQIELIDRIYDKNAEVLHWLQVLELHKKVYGQADELAEEFIGNITKAPKPINSDTNDSTMDAWHLIRAECMSLVPHEREVLFSEMCANQKLQTLIKDLLPDMSEAPNSLSLVVSKAVNHCVARGLLWHCCPERDSFKRLDASHVAELIVNLLKASPSKPATVSMILAKLRENSKYKGVPMQLVEEAIRILEAHSRLKKHSMNTYRLL